MKKILLSFFILFLSLSASAGNPFGDSTAYQWIIDAKPTPMEKGEKQIGSLADLKNESRLYCFYYTDDAFYSKQPITDTMKEFYNDNRLKSESEICSKFIESANEELPKGIYLTGNKERISRYILKLHVVSVDTDGETDLYAMVFDTMDKKLVYQKLYNANGGHFGSLTNLMGDAAKRLGKKVGKDISKRIDSHFVQSDSYDGGERYNAGWNEFTFDIGYGYTYESGSYDNEDIATVSVNYARGIHLNRSNGLTLRPVTGVFYGYQDKKINKIHDYSYDRKKYFFSITQKLDIGYHVVWPNSFISIFPYAGVTTRINVWGEIDRNGKKDDLFGSYYNYFQVGGRVGFDVHFKKFLLGVTYEYDFSDFYDDAKIGTANLKLGWCF